MALDVKGNMGLMGMLPQKSRRLKALPDMAAEAGSLGEEGWSELAGLVLEAEIQDQIREQGERERRERKRVSQEKEKESQEWHGTWLGVEGKGSEPEVEIELNVSMNALARRLGVRTQDLITVRDQIAEEVWLKKRMERVTRLEMVRSRLSNWSELEYLATAELIDRFANGRIVETNEIAGIAQLAARMTQVERDKGRDGTGNVQVNLQLNNVNSSSPNGDLPGAGHLGKINLSISGRTARQLAQPMIRKDEGFLDSIEMLGAKDVPSLVQKTNEGESDE